jgi:hypothetical protein
MLTDHPDVEELYRRSSAVDSKISIATVYRTVRLFRRSRVYWTAMILVMAAPVMKRRLKLIMTI